MFVKGVNPVQYKEILHNHAKKFSLSYNNPNPEVVEAGQNFALNYLDILYRSKRKAGQLHSVLSNEHFNGLDMRKCSGKGYYVANTTFESCYINRDFFQKSAVSYGEVYNLKFIEHGGDKDKFIALLTEYGEFVIYEFKTGRIRFKSNYFQEHVVQMYGTVKGAIGATSYKNEILVVLFFSMAAKPIVNRFCKDTFNYLGTLDLNTDTISDDMWADMFPDGEWLKMFPQYPFVEKHYYSGNRLYAKEKDGSLPEGEVEYAIWRDARGLNNNGQVKFESQTMKTLGAKETLSNIYQNSKLLDEQILWSEMFSFYSDIYGYPVDEYKLFVGFGNLSLAMELEIDKDVQIRKLREVIFTPDKKRMIAYNQVSSPWIFVWELPTGKLTKLTVCEHRVAAAVCTSDSKYVVVSGSFRDNELKVFDLRYGKSATSIENNAKISSGCLLSDTTYVTGLDNGFIKVWDISATPKSATAVFYTHGDAVNGIVKMDDKSFASYSRDCSLRVWKYSEQDKKFVCLPKLIGHSSPVLFSAVCSEGLISVCYKEIIVWDLTKNCHKKIIPLTDLPKYRGEGLGLSADGTKFAYMVMEYSDTRRSTPDLCTLIIYNIKENTHREIALNAPCQHVAFSSCGNRIAVDGVFEFIVFDINDELPIPKEVARRNIDFMGHNPDLHSVSYMSYSPQGKALIIVTLEGLTFFYGDEEYNPIPLATQRFHQGIGEPMSPWSAIDTLVSDVVVVANNDDFIYMADLKKSQYFYLENINTDVGCRLKNLHTDDISDNFLSVLQGNGFVLETPKKVENSRKSFLQKLGFAK